MKNVGWFMVVVCLFMAGCVQQQELEEVTIVNVYDEVSTGEADGRTVLEFTSDKTRTLRTGKLGKVGDTFMERRRNWE